MVYLGNYGCYSTHKGGFTGNAHYLKTCDGECDDVSSVSILSGFKTPRNQQPFIYPSYSL